jgi:hypothetical protein
VELKIKYLTLTGCTLPLHAMHHWPNYILAILSSFAIKCAEDNLSNLHINIEGLSPEMKFSKSKSHGSDVGCLCYILDLRVKTNPKGSSKWEPRA